MEKNSLEKLKNLMLKKYRKEISFQQLQKEFLKNDNERIEYIKTELEKAYNEKNGKSINTLILAIYMFELHSEKFVDILCKLTKKEVLIIIEKFTELLYSLYYVEKSLIFNTFIEKLLLEEGKKGKTVKIYGIID